MIHRHYLAFVILLTGCGTSYKLTRGQLAIAQVETPDKSCLVYLHLEPPTFHSIKAVTLAHGGDDLRDTSESSDLVFIGVRPGPFQIKEIIYESAGTGGSLAGVDGHIAGYQFTNEKQLSCSKGAIWLGAYTFGNGKIQPLSESEQKSARERMAKNLAEQLKETAWAKELK